MNQAAIGQYIAGKRTAQGMTQEQLAQKIGVSQKSLMRWETGKRLPDADAVEALCTALGITLPELLNGKDSPQKEETPAGCSGRSTSSIFSTAFC